MHHSLRLYGRFRQVALRYYLFQVRWTRLPLLGGLVRRVANGYGRSVHGALALTQEEAHGVVEAATSLWLGPCRCRQVSRHCSAPVETEIMVGRGGEAMAQGRPGEYRPISLQEAQEVQEKCRRQGLIPTLMRCQGQVYALCHCCPCCCVPWRLKRDYGIGRALVRDPGIVQKLTQEWRGP